MRSYVFWTSNVRRYSDSSFIIHILIDGLYNLWHYLELELENEKRNL